MITRSPFGPEDPTGPGLPISPLMQRNMHEVIFVMYISRKKAIQVMITFIFVGKFSPVDPCGLWIQAILAHLGTPGNREIDKNNCSDTCIV